MRKFVATLICMFLFPCFTFAQIDHVIDSTKVTASKKETRKAKRELERKQMKQHFSIGGHATYAFINSAVRFEERNSIFSAQVDLEKHFGLDDEKFVYSGFAVYRITPRSGVNGLYYQLNRRKVHVLETDIVFLDDTIKKGTEISGYLNISVASVGYMFSILTEPKSFLGVYVNLYMSHIKVGFRADALKIEKSATYFTAMPNIGIMASFRLAKWFTLAGRFGFFYFSTEYLSGTFLDSQILAEFNPTKWLGLSIGYQVYDVTVKFQEEKYTAYLDYNLKGPSVGLRFRF